MLLKHCTRARYFSTAPRTRTVYDEYERSLVRKFIFQVHPDFFGKFRNYKNINDTNLKHLQAILHGDESYMQIIQNDNRKEQSFASTRTLTFYLKPVDNDDNLVTHPKKVKVALNRLTDSLCEILDTIGVDLPIKPVGYVSYTLKEIYRQAKQQQAASSSSSSSSSTYMDSETLAIKEFIESIVDRREIICLKRERYLHFQQIEQVTGLISISYQNSWSLQNNLLLLLSLHAAYVKHYAAAADQLQKEQPRSAWSGWQLVIKKDVSSSVPVLDYEEGRLVWDCSGMTIAQFMQTILLDITPIDIDDGDGDGSMRRYKETMQEMMIRRQDVQRMTIAMEKSFSQQATAAIATLADALIDGQRRPLQVKIIQGYTCSQRNYTQLLSILYNAAQHAASAQQLSSHRVQLDQPDEELTNNNNDLNHPALALPIIIEENYGHLKLLPSTGQLRLDAAMAARHGNTPTISQQLFTAETLQPWITCALAYEQRKVNRDQLTARINEELELVSLGSEVGVSPEQYQQALEQLANYLDHCKQRRMTTANDWVKKGLQGMKVSIGHYASIKEEGTAVIPFHFCYPVEI